MSPVWLWAIVVWVPVPPADGGETLAVGATPCRPQPSCDQCVQSHPDCSWCKQKNFTKAGEPDSTRCDRREKLVQRGCRGEEVVSPGSSHRVLQSRELGQRAEGEGTVQLTPQRVALTLRPGQPESFQVRFRRAEGYPVDLYYLMDLSYSMKDDLENIRKLGSNLLVALKNISDSVKIGFGSFVDKTAPPFISLIPRRRRNPCPDRTERCQPPFSFRNVLPLTGEAAEFEREVGQQEVSGNLDTPEGGLDAMMQAAVCEKEVGWRNVTRLLVYTSDAIFHTAGDGRLGGIFLPNDARCHLNQAGLYAESDRYDYPSVGQLAQTLSQLNVQPIFAVTQNVMPVYQELSKLIPRSAVGELRADSSNVLQLISEAYNNLSSTVRMEHSALPEGLSLTFQSHCGGPNPSPPGRGECSGVRINQEIGFTVRVTASRCLGPGSRFKLRAMGFAETLEVGVETACACQCGDAGGGRGDPHCSDGNGTLVCGQCSCFPGRVGQLCECSRDEVPSQDLLQPCRRGNETALCGGRGQCVCGKCVCDGSLRGEFCECDDSSCVRHNSKLCGGQGRCNCGTCVCNAGYTGDACQCSRDNAGCLHTDGSLCAGHGDCQCNQCLCNRGYTGPTCGTCPNCPTPCQLLTDCAECLAFGTGRLTDDCGLTCRNLTAAVVKKLPEGDLWCMERLPEGEVIEFVVEGREWGRHLVVREREVPRDNRVAIISGVMAGIVLVGLLVLVAWRSVMVIRDRREYRRFLTEREKAKWDLQRNPLFHSATTTTVNPQFLPD